MGPHSDVFKIEGSDSEDRISNMKAELFQLKLYQKVNIWIWTRDHCIMNPALYHWAKLIVIEKCCALNKYKDIDCN